MGGIGGYERRTTTAGAGGDDILIDQSDYFGKIRYHKDLGGHEFNYTYNNAGWLMDQTGTTGTSARNAQHIAYDYYQNGFLKSISDTGISSFARFQYDKNGNRTLESYSQAPINAGPQQMNPLQVATAEYDELNRLKHVYEAGKYDIRYTYDANGNRRSVESTYTDLLVNTPPQVQNFYYMYDRMNRFLITMGQRDSAGRIIRGTTGFEIQYDAPGRRASAYSDHLDKNGQPVAIRDAYLYDPINTVREVQMYDVNGTLVGRSVRQNDTVGNLRHYQELDAFGNQVNSIDHQYDADSLVTLDDDRTDPNQRKRTRYSYLGNSVLDSTVADTIDTNGNQMSGTALVTLSYAYEKWDSYKQSTVSITATAEHADGWQPGTSTYQYDSDGHIKQVFDSQANRTLSYINNHLGQILKRYQIDREAGGSDKPPVIRRFYFLNGIGIGEVGTDKIPSRVDYAQSLAEHERERQDKDHGVREATDEWGNVTWEPIPRKDIAERVFPVTSADFDQNFQPINADYPPHAPQFYIIRSGDTLQGISRAMWGDANVWYLLADANGLQGGEQLVPGVRLTVPNVVTNIHNNAHTFRPYDPGLALGDTTPTLPGPPPPAEKCGGMGGIIVMIVIVVIAAITEQWWLVDEAGPAAEEASAAAFAAEGTEEAAAQAYADTLAVGQTQAAVIGAAAGNVAGQVAAAALRLQNGFNAGSFFSSMLTAGITQRLGLNVDLDKASWSDVAWNAAQKNLINQGANLIAGQQKTFSWQSLLASTISAPLTNDIDKRLGTVDNNRQNGYAKVTGGAQPFSFERLGKNIAGEFAKASIRSTANMLVNRDGEVNWNSIAVDAFGNGIGNTIALDVRYRDAHARHEAYVRQSMIDPEVSLPNTQGAGRANAVGISLDPNEGVTVADSGLGFSPLAERDKQDLAFITKYREQLAKTGALPTDARNALARGVDGDISWDFARLFGKEGVAELFGIPVGPLLDVPLRAKLRDAVDPSLPSGVTHLFAGVGTDAGFEDQVISVFNSIGGRATDEQMFGVMNQIRVNRNTDSSAFVVDITKARLTSEAGAFAARGFGFDTIDRLSFGGDLFAGPTGPTVTGRLATTVLRGVSQDLSFATDNLAPSDLVSNARNSLILDALAVGGPAAASGLFKLGRAYLFARASGTIEGSLDAGLASRGFRPPVGTREVPEGWRIRPTRGEGGVWYYDPSIKGNAVRVMPGDPTSPFPNSQAPYVRWQHNGQPLDINGNVLPTKNSADAHIPLNDFKFDPDLFR